MQRPAELVPIPWCGVEALESSGKLLHFGKIPKTLGQNLAKIQQKSGKFQQFLTTILRLENGGI